MSSRQLFKRRRSILFLGGIALLSLALSFSLLNPASAFRAAFASPPLQTTPLPVQMSIGNETCLGCHGNPNISMALENGEIAGLYVPAELYESSIHGELGYACVQCHTTVGDYPHPPFVAQDLRDLTLKLNDACGRCHSNQALLAHDSVHAKAMQEGNRNAAVCVDCHAAHTTQQLTDPNTGQLTEVTRQLVPQTCAKCHYAIYQKYATSVHGAALLEENNLDVPTCIDCHGVHNIESPTTTQFRLQSPELCANCHTDAQLMAKYALSTQVLDTYVADFHGTTVTLFEKQHPDQETNKPVCYDCHGIHDIQSVDNPVTGLGIKANLLIRCQACHPDANMNFPDAWLSHYIPTANRHPLIFTVNMFYVIFIPTVLGGMAVLVALDVSKQARSRLGKKKQPGKVGVFTVPSTTSSPTQPPPAQSSPVAAGDPEPQESHVLPDGAPEAESEPAEQEDGFEQKPEGSPEERPAPKDRDSSQEADNG